MGRIRDQAGRKELTLTRTTSSTWYEVQATCKKGARATEGSTKPALYKMQHLDVYSGRLLLMARFEVRAINTKNGCARIL